MLDESMGNCSICNGFFQNDNLRDFSSEREIMRELAGNPKGNRVWPDDAPIW